MREDNIRQAGGAGAVGYGLVALFELAWLMIGGLAWFWWPPLLPRDLRYGEFMLNMVGWTVVLTSLAWVNWRRARARAVDVGGPGREHRPDRIDRVGIVLRRL